MGGQSNPYPIIAITAAPSGTGYWLLPGLASPEPTCRPSQLSAYAYKGSGGGGQEGIVVVFRNVSVTSCSLEGYPTAWFVNPAGSRISAVSTAETGNGPATQVDLAPGATANTVVNTPNPDVPPPSYCQVGTAAGIDVVVPSENNVLFAAISLGFCTTHSGVGTTPITPGSTQR